METNDQSAPELYSPELFPEELQSETQATEVSVKANRPVAFGRFVKPEMYDVFGDYDLSSVTEEEKEWMQPERLGSILFQPKDDTKFRLDGIVLNATEHAMIARSPFKLIEHAEEQSLKDKDLDDVVLATAARAQLHALETKAVVMAAHHEKLVNQRAMLIELRREAKKPGFAHKSEERMKELTSAAWLEFKTILDVVHIQRGWDDAARTRAEAALIHHLTQGSQRTRIAHWQGMIELANGYLGARVHMYNGRIKSVSGLLERKNAEYAERFA